MNIEHFADLGGCVVVVCGPGWGGKYGYTSTDSPNCTTCGFKTKKEARKAWVQDTFGEVAGRAVMQLIESSNAELRGRPLADGPA